MGITLGNVIENDRITGYGSLNIIIFTIVGIMGIFMGLFFGIQFLLKSKMEFLAINVMAFLVGIAALFFLYWYTGKK
jgi:hypothetical protein